MFLSDLEGDIIFGEREDLIYLLKVVKGRQGDIVWQVLVPVFGILNYVLRKDGDAGISQPHQGFLLLPVNVDPGFTLLHADKTEQLYFCKEKPDEVYHKARIVLFVPEVRVVGYISWIKQSHENYHKMIIHISIP